MAAPLSRQRRNAVKDFLKSLGFKVLTVVALFLVGVMIYAASTGGAATIPATIVSAVVTPLQTIASSLSDGVNSFIGIFTDSGRLREENDKLQEEINHWFNEIAQDREILCYYNSSASMLPLVERGMGIAICPGAARYFAGGEGIIYKTIVKPRKESRLYMVRRRYQMLPQAAGAFWDFAGRKFCGAGAS